MGLLSSELIEFQYLLSYDNLFFLKDLFERVNILCLSVCLPNHISSLASCFISPIENCSFDFICTGFKICFGQFCLCPTLVKVNGTQAVFAVLL